MFDSSELDTPASKYTMPLLSAIVVLALTAFTISLYLSWATWGTDNILGCSGGSTVDCDAVLSSPWSKWLGLPVSIFGVLSYGVILALAWPAAKQPLGLAGTCLLALSLLAAGAAIWFTMVQAIFIKSFCPFCMGVHFCGCAIAVLILLQIYLAPTEIDYDQRSALLGVRNTADSPIASSTLQVGRQFHPLVATGAACVGLVVLMGGQFLFAPPTMLVETFENQQSSDLEEEEPEEFSFAATEKNIEDAEEVSANDLPNLPPTDTSQRLITVDGLPDAIDINDYPILGNPAAPHVFVEMLDYTCAHCRQLHLYVQATQERYGDQVAFVIYHVPLSKHCNPNIKKDHPGNRGACDFARLAMSVSELAPEKFSEYHNWLMESEKPPSAGEARRHALQLVGEEVLINEEIREQVTQKILTHCKLFKQQKAALPMLLTEEGIIRGIPRKLQQWYVVMERQFGLKPAAGAPPLPGN